MEPNPITAPPEYFTPEEAFELQHLLQDPVPTVAVGESQRLPHAVNLWQARQAQQQARQTQQAIEEEQRLTHIVNLWQARQVQQQAQQGHPTAQQLLQQAETIWDAHHPRLPDHVMITLSEEERGYREMSRWVGVLNILCQANTTPMYPQQK